MLFPRRSPPMIDIQRLPSPVYVGKKCGGAEAKFFGFSQPWLDFQSKPGRTAIVEKILGNELSRTDS